MKKKYSNSIHKSLKRFQAYLSPRPSELESEKKMVIVKTKRIMFIRTISGAKDWIEIASSNGSRAYCKTSLVRFNQKFESLFAQASDCCLINPKYVIQVSTPNGFGQLYLGDENLGYDCPIEKIKTGIRFRENLKEVLPQFLCF